MENEKRDKILVVDDDERWLRKITSILQPDYNLTLTTDPSEALEAVREYSYSLVILDMKLPNGVSGLDIFSQMQEISSNLRAIILTGYPDAGSMRSSFKKGFLDYLEKGASNLSNELREVVRESLEKRLESDVAVLIARGENETVEFKASARWDMRANKHNKELEKTIIKTVAAFLNSEIGGRLLIGVGDNGAIIGVEQDYLTLGKKKDRDGYENFLTSIILDTCGRETSPLVRVTFHQLEGKDVCLIGVKPSPKPVFVPDDKGEHFFIRAGNSTRLLSTREAIEYCKIRWKV